MVRNFSLTFGAVTLRLYLPSVGGAGVPFEVAYPIIAWACVGAEPDRRGVVVQSPPCVAGKYVQDARATAA